MAIASLSACRQQPAISIDRLEVAATSTDAMSDSTLSCYNDALSVLGSIYKVSSADSAMIVYAASPAQRVFSPDIMAHFPSLDQTESDIASMMSELSRALPTATLPSHFVSFATPYNQSIIVADTTLLIALNHYLGPDYEGYRSFESYQRAQKTPERIPADVAEAILASLHPYAPDAQSATTLSRMVYEGALVAGVRMALPDAEEAFVLGYSPEEYKWAVDNEARAWQTIVEGDLLFSSDPAIADRLLLPSPSTSLVNANAPGRLGRFIGYRIIKSYMENNTEDDLGHLLDPTFYNSPDVLKKARYAP